MLATIATLQNSIQFKSHHIEQKDILKKNFSMKLIWFLGVINTNF
jgi:hypothetical protein